MTERQLDSRSNSVILLGTGSERRVLKRFQPKQVTVKTFKYRVLKTFGWGIPVEYRSELERREFEIDCLRLWSKLGLPVPQICELPKNETSIVLSYVEGPTLAEFLGDPETSQAMKWEAIEDVLLECHHRHCLALYEEESRLIHFDSNMRNIILSSDGPVRIDFEMGRLNEKINRSAAREIYKLALEIACEIVVGHLEALVDRLFSHYQIVHILRTIANLELTRSFAWYHDWKDTSRKEVNPAKVTKRDLARAIKRRLTPPKLVGGNENLTEAEATSWDGKFYQSFDDGDPRGRNMPHRYKVMEFPEEFEGASILDIGCNLGRICIDARKNGGGRAVVIDFREDVMKAVSQYVSEEKIEAEFYPFDINDGVEALQKLVGAEPFDYVCILSIWSHVDQPKLWSIVNAMCGKVCYFEDNSPSRVKSLERMEEILRENLDFPKVEFLGFATDRGVRAIFRLSKN